MVSTPSKYTPTITPVPICSLPMSEHTYNGYSPVAAGVVDDGSGVPDGDNEEVNNAATAHMHRKSTIRLELG